jgi:hypothetical protein
VEINGEWESIGVNINNSGKTSQGYDELKEHKPWFDEGRPKNIRPKETSQIAVVTGSKRNTRGKSEKYKT